MKKILNASLWFVGAAILLVALLVYEYVREYLNPRYEMRKPK